MSTIKHTLGEDVFAVFERACLEKEFELADHLLLALEAIARRRKDAKQLDVAYLLLAATCEEVDDWQQESSLLLDGKTGQPILKAAKVPLVAIPVQRGEARQRGRRRT
ncbi:hypothetical protein [Cupriavidus basilensis]|uniref:hypothetical protein n=1 Tax=Cupriavidus basilensis TaxID=68895 RepID=UPI0039F6CCB0